MVIEEEFFEFFSVFSTIVDSNCKKLVELIVENQKELVELNVIYKGLTPSSKLFSTLRKIEIEEDSILNIIINLDNGKIITSRFDIPHLNISVNPESKTISFQAEKSGEWKRSLFFLTHHFSQPLRFSMLKRLSIAIAEPFLFHLG